MPDNRIPRDNLTLVTLLITLAMFGGLAVVVITFACSQ